ncbi:MAG: hypothetical protein EA417_15075 [Gammaproteobacteria bacterium]|nr:MAG: hypothetical protein EA417_15075 [Gammaproteobacteria bacterium]
MNNRMRERAKAHMPMVLLTLLSIIQALALELTWEHIGEQSYLLEATWTAALGWLQIATTLLSILLIWLLYSTMVMRFRWVPSTSDTLFPFAIGIIEFTLIFTLGPETYMAWFIVLALLFAITHWSIQRIMVAARKDSENATFFSKVSPAILRDFLPTIAICAVLAGLGLAIGLTGDQAFLALLGMLLAAAAIIYQIFLNARYWQQAMALDDEPDPT